MLRILFIALIAAGSFTAGLYFPSSKYQTSRAATTNETGYEQVTASNNSNSQSGRKVITSGGIEASEIILKSSQWGGARPEDILKVLNSAKSVLDTAFQSDAKNNVWVYQNLQRGHPITLYQKGPDGQYKIELSSSERYWAKYAYQFSHEYCHVRTNYEDASPKTMWFEEVIGELCSIYTLQRMSKIWADNPPYENWRDYAGSIKEYSDEIINREANKLPPGVGFGNWFESNLSELEQNPRLRDKNAIIAIKLLPLFEQHPSLWDSITYWNKWGKSDDANSDIQFLNWLAILPAENKTPVRKLISLFEL